MSNCLDLSENQFANISAVIEDDPSRYIELFNKMLDHKCTECEKTSVRQRLASASSVAFVMTQNENDKLVQVDSANLENARFPTATYNMAMKKTILSRQRFENTEFEELMATGNENSLMVHSAYNATSSLMVCKALCIWSFLPLDSKETPIFSENDLLQHLKIAQDAEKELKGRIAGLNFPLVVVDFTSPILSEYLSFMSGSKKQQDFFQLMDFNWPLYSQYKYKRIYESGRYDVRRRNLLQDTTVDANFITIPGVGAFESSWFCEITHRAWIFTQSCGSIGGVILQYITPKSLFFPSDDNDKLFGTDSRMVPYCGNFQFFKDLGCVSTVTVDVLRSLFETWSSDESFRASLNQMNRIYIEISKKYLDFAKECKIFVPLESGGADDFVRGEFLDPKWCCLKDKGEFFDNNYKRSELTSVIARHGVRNLHEIYRSVEHFREFGVPDESTDDHYIHFLLNLHNSSQIIPDEQYLDIVRLCLGWFAYVVNPERTEKFTQIYLPLIRDCKIIPIRSADASGYTFGTINDNLVFRTKKDEKSLPIPNSIEVLSDKKSNRFFTDYLHLPVLSSLQRKMLPVLCREGYDGFSICVPKYGLVVLVALIDRELQSCGDDELRQSKNVLSQIQIEYCDQLKEFYERCDTNQAVAWTVRAISNGFDSSQKNHVWYCNVSMARNPMYYEEFGSSLLEHLKLANPIAEKFKSIMEFLSTTSVEDSNEKIDEMLKQKFSIDLRSNGSLIESTTASSTTATTGNSIRSNSFEIDFGAPLAVYNPSIAGQPSDADSDIEILGFKREHVYKKKEGESSSYTAMFSTVGPLASASPSDERTTDGAIGAGGGSGGGRNLEINIEHHGSPAGLELNREKFDFADYLDFAGQLSADELNPVLALSGEAVGQWGEQFIYNKLKSDAIPGYSNISWVNEPVESSKHYDLFGTYEGHDVWIEVKTSTKNSPLIPFGLSQLLAGVSDKYRECYHVFVIFVNEEGIKCVRITNLDEFLKRRQRLFLRVEREEKNM